MNTEELGAPVTHQVLAGAGLPCRELEVLPSDEQEQEERQHEELPVPHRHQEDLKRGHDSQRHAKPITLRRRHTFQIPASLLPQQNI